MEISIVLAILSTIGELTKLYREKVKPALEQSAELTPAQRAELTAAEEAAFASDYWQPKPPTA